MRVWTIGHSTRTAGLFLSLLAREGIQRIVDVRSFPTSRRAPWASAGMLAGTLARHGLAYSHLPELGGFRKPLPDTTNLAWREEAFRGYADHMGSEEFRKGMDALRSLAADESVAVMCAESDWRRCHRALLADALLARGAEVIHIVDEGTERHVLTPSARVEGARVTYPARGGVQTRLT